MAPSEVNQIEKVSEEMSLTRKAVEEMRADFRVFVTKLMGDDEEENERGRFPQLERRVASHERRIVRLERFLFILIGIVVAVKGIASLIEAIPHIISILRGV